MVAKSFSEKIILKTRRDVLRLHLYKKFLQHGIRPYENDISIIVELYCLGGYGDEDRQEQFFTMCIQKKLKKSRQSVRNTCSKYTSLGVLEKTRNLSLHVSEKFIPSIEFDKLFLQDIISHAD